MSAIFEILRTAHCRSTHHYFAIDALRQLQTAQAQRLGNLLLKHHDDYLVGATAPDSNFKDFANQVIYVSDNHWGGAPRMCLQWLRLVRAHLDHGRWKKAAYACGVLSHYFTDPIMPLHAQASLRGDMLHRPMEWSIYRAYDEIYQRCRRQEQSVSFEFAQDEEWIAKAVTAAATLAAGYHDRLLEGYDVQQALVRPGQALGETAREALAELFSIAIDGWATALTRLADETVTQLPRVSLAAPTVLAAIDRPLARLVRRLSDAREARAVRATVREYQRTGKLERHLPLELRAIREARAAESIRPEEKPRSSPAQPLAMIVAPTSIALAGAPQEIGDAAAELAASTSVVPPSARQRAEANSPVAADAAIASNQALNEPFRPAVEAASGAAPQLVSLSEARARWTGQSSMIGEGAVPWFQPEPAPHWGPPPEAASTAANQPVPDTADSKSLHPIAGEARHTSSLAYTASLSDSPVIGPKTAKRLESIGIGTIGQFISAGAEDVASRLATRWITEDLIRDWQDQVRLSCDVPELSVVALRWLVAAGCRTAWQLRNANADRLWTQIQPVVAATEGQPMAGGSPQPNNDEIAAWIAVAQHRSRRHQAA